MAEDMKVEKADKAEKPKKKSVSVGDVLAKDKAPKSEAKSSKTAAKRKHKHTHIEHHDDGSHTVRHTPAGGGDEVSYAAPDLNAVKAGLDQNVGGGDMAASQPEPRAADTSAMPMAQPQPQAV